MSILKMDGTVHFFLFRPLDLISYSIFFLIWPVVQTEQNLPTAIGIPPRASQPGKPHLLGGGTLVGQEETDHAIRAWVVSPCEGVKKIRLWSAEV